MKARYDLWVRLKVVDLVAQTAWMTMTEKLGLEGELIGLAHYSFWRMEIDAEDRKSALDEIDRAIRLDSAFTNQNKHLYMLRTDDEPARGDLRLDKDFPVLAENGVARRGFAVDCLVRELGSGREDGYRDRLNARLDNARITGLVAGEVWRILLVASDEKEAVDKVERIAITTSRREGLLLNPHYQRLEILSAVPI